MRITKSFKLALNILLHSKLRSWLTIIGIVIGIGAVVSIVSISAGAKQQLEERLGDFGADILTISPGFRSAQGSRGGFMRHGEQDSTTTSEQKNLTSKDILVLKNIDNIKFVHGEVSDNTDVTYSTKSAPLSIKGVDTTVWKDITTEVIKTGRLLTQGDSYSVVIGGNIVTSTFDEGIPLNQNIIIEGKNFKVVGILESGNSVYMPIEITRITLEDIGEKEFNSISVKIEDLELSDQTVIDINNKLMMSRGIINEKNKDFSVYNPAERQESIRETMNTMGLFLGAIAAISLLVGGIGIANTMFTSVLEKTKEIGIMKAIGAQNKDILTIFLINSGLIGLVGGLGGVVLGLLGSGAIGMMGSNGGGMTRMFSSTLISPQLIIGSLLFSIIIGMIAGIIPAYRASRLSPVDALRYE
ncbi:ABC transporter permease [Candidatus Pacearchaeota archaeon]|nr:ABC transporter permease [Candidatus Pacearchaeota archaeon]